MKCACGSIGPNSTGSQKVGQPLGLLVNFDAFKLAMSQGDGSPSDMTYWIDKATYKPVKMQASLPQMGGAIMTIELK